jgi:hypothetical protein
MIITDMPLHCGGVFLPPVAREHLYQQDTVQCFTAGEAAYIGLDSTSGLRGQGVADGSGQGTTLEHHDA